jgi:hypothetical protein
MSLLFQLTAIALVLGTVVAAVGQSRAAVSRDRLARFARHHELPITVHNGDEIIRYLAVTRRWRAAGLTAGTLVSLLYSLRSDRITVDFFAMFAGWFAGALVAEMRLVQRQTGSRRAATLLPRTYRRYVGRLVWALPASALALSVGLWLASAVLTGRAATLVRAPFITGVAGAALAVGAVVLIRHRVVARAQPVLPPDRLAADEAVRSRSLHVLCASGATLALYGTLVQLGALARSGVGHGVPLTLTGIGVVVIPVLGWQVATAHRPVHVPAAGPETA